jgi:hypothetical protein
VIQKKPGQLGSEMHACSRMLDLPKPGACSHLSRLPALESSRREQWREAAAGGDFSLDAFTVKTMKGRLMTHAGEDFLLDEWYSENNGG